MDDNTTTAAASSNEDDNNSLQIADTSPYIYVATCCFALSAFSSDLLFIRGSLTLGFLFLTLASLSSYSLDGSFSLDTLNLNNQILDIPMLINMVLFVLNLFICLRLINDELPKTRLSDQERALFRFFQSRCGLTPLQFRYILKHGEFVELPPHTAPPNLESTLYLVLEGKVQCQAQTKNQATTIQTFFKRSGEFFDLKLFNILTFPVGFDSFVFQAHTTTRTQFFAWNVDGLVAMRDLQSPLLKPYWEFMVLRALTNSAVRHHLGDADTLYDSWQIPEDAAWLDGAPSRDFRRLEKPVGNWDHVLRQWTVLTSSFWNIIPPHGVRHRPGPVVPDPKQTHVERIAKAKLHSQEFYFLKPSTTMAILEQEKQQQQYNNNNNMHEGVNDGKNSPTIATTSQEGPHIPEASDQGDEENA